jgi:hypothetical protein
VTRKGNTSFVVATRFGNVHVLVNERTEIYMPPQGQVRFDALEIGDNVGVLLVKAENEDTSAADPSEAGSDPVMRTATALKVLIVPDRATRRHIRAMVLEKARDRIKVIDENGEEREIESDVEVAGEAGDELLLVTQDGENGRGARLRTFVLPHILEVRLDRIEERRDDLKDRLDEVRERNAKVREEIVDRVKERLADVDVAPEVRERVRAAADELKDRLQDRAEEARNALEERREKREAAREANADERKDERNADPAATRESPEDRKPTAEPTRESKDDRANISDDKAEANADQVRR